MGDDVEPDYKLIKQRIARPGEGKSGGFRTVLALKSQTAVFFLFGFAKNDRENIDKADLERLREQAKDYLSHDGDALQALLDEEAIIEIECPKKARNE